MSNEKYVNYYVDILTSTMTDAVIRNVSLQANAKVVDDVIKEQAKKLENLQNKSDELQATPDELKQKNSSAENVTIKAFEER